MVLQFLDATKPADAERQTEVAAKITNWWEEFSAKRPAIEQFLKGESDWDLDNWMNKMLQALDPEIMWEFGAEVSGDFQLVITAESERRLRPLVQKIVQQAPATKSWRFYAYRQAQNIADTQEIVLDRTGIDLDQFQVLVRPGQGNLIDCLFLTKGFHPDKEEALTHAAFLIIESCAGEQILDQWIGEIEVVGPHDAVLAEAQPQAFTSCANLPNSLWQEIQRIIASQPNTPIYKLKDTLLRADFSLEADQADDYAERLDMVAATSILPEMWKSAHSGFPFDSIRFSKCGERFCYLKMDGLDSYANTARSRQRVATTLDEKLMAANLGCTIGGAGGLRYSYIDLCLTDVPAALEIIKAVLLYEHMPERSWLLFFDTDWCQEWVGIFPNTPAPALTPDTEAATD